MYVCICHGETITYAIAQECLPWKNENSESGEEAC